MKRFWDKVDQSGGPNACWPWQSSLIYSGYGMFWHMGRARMAHRIAYELANSHSPGELEVRHACDNRRCCNPAHLLVGTHQDNMDDATARDRIARGSRSPFAKLTEGRVVEIRALRTQGIGVREIGRRLGMSHSVISRAIRGKTWGHVA